MTHGGPEHAAVETPKVAATPVVNAQPSALIRAETQEQAEVLREFFMTANLTAAQDDQRCV